MTRRLWLLAALAPLVGLGCGGPSKDDAPAGPTGAETAEDVAGMLRDHYEQTQKAPTGVASLTDAPASHPVGHAAVASGEFVVFWKTPVSASAGGTVLAYHRDVPASGGFVVMQDGSVQQMSAEEFRAAPKAGK
jgi:hypothetical protein